MSSNKNIEKLFKDKLFDAEVSVRPELWDKVATGAGIGKTSFWSLGKVLFFSSVVVALGTALFFFLPNQESKQQAHEDIKDTVLEQNSNLENNLTPKNDVILDEEKPDVENTHLPETTQTEAKNKENTNTTKIDNLKGLVLDDNSISIMETSNPNIKPTEHPLFNDQNDLDKQISATHKDRPDEIEYEFFDFEALKPGATQENKTASNRLYAYEENRDLTLEEIHFPEPFAMVFAPNLPGEGGQFNIVSKDLSSFEIVIMTRAGKTIYKSNDPNFVWKGEQMDGTLAPEGTYVYTISARTKSGEDLKPQVGSVYLMRR